MRLPEPSHAMTMSGTVCCQVDWILILMMMMMMMMMMMIDKAIGPTKNAKKTSVKPEHIVAEIFGLVLPHVATHVYARQYGCRSEEFHLQNIPLHRGQTNSSIRILWRCCHDHLHGL